MKKHPIETQCRGIDIQKGPHDYYKKVGPVRREQSADNLNEIVAAYLISSNLPLSHVESRYFCNLVDYLNPQARKGLVKSTKITKISKDLGSKFKASLIAFMQSDSVLKKFDNRRLDFYQQ